ncbi:MAG: carbohydrate ABC transporter permease, partial [Eubacteriales bacterium]|nr:carbohydrate ABC transporter permease [Eubacteriales bacterium]
NQLMDPTVVWIPRSVTFDNIINVWDKMQMPNSLYKSILVALGSSILQLISCSVTGYGFARFNFKGKSILFGMVLLTIIVPPQTIIIPSFLGFKFFDFFGLGSIPMIFGGQKLYVNLLDSILTYYLPAFMGVGIRAGLFIYIFRQFFRGLPNDIEDAAYIDGCGFFKTFVKIMIPCASGSFISVFLFSVVWYWSDYYYGSMMMQNANTLSLALATLRLDFSRTTGVEFTNIYEIYALLQAGCLLVVLPILLLFLFFQRYFREGIERTGIVG